MTYRTDQTTTTDHTVRQLQQEPSRLVRKPGYIEENRVKTTFTTAKSFEPNLEILLSMSTFPLFRGFLGLERSLCLTS